MKRFTTIALGLTLLGSAWLLPANAHAQDDDLEGIAAIADTLFTGDEDAIRPLIGYSQFPCEDEPMGIGALPMCLDGEEEGTLVNGLTIGSCEGVIVRDEEVDEIVEFLATPGPQFVAVHAVPQRTFDAGYVAIYTNVYMGDSGRAYGVWIADGKITNLGGGCGENVEEYATGYELGPEVELQTVSPGLPSTGRGRLEQKDHGTQIAAWIALLGVVLVSGGALALARRR